MVFADAKYEFQAFSVHQIVARQLLEHSVYTRLLLVAIATQEHAACVFFALLIPLAIHAYLVSAGLYSAPQ